MSLERSAVLKGLYVKLRSYVFIVYNKPLCCIFYVLSTVFKHLTNINFLALVTTL